MSRLPLITLSIARSSSQRSRRLSARGPLLRWRRMRLRSSRLPRMTSSRRWVPCGVDDVSYTDRSQVSGKGSEFSATTRLATNSCGPACCACTRSSRPCRRRPRSLWASRLTSRLCRRAIIEALRAGEDRPERSRRDRRASPAERRRGRPRVRQRFRSAHERRHHLRALSFIGGQLLHQLASAGGWTDGPTRISMSGRSSRCRQLWMRPPRRSSMPGARASTTLGTTRSMARPSSRSTLRRCPSSSLRSTA